MKRIDSHPTGNLQLFVTFQKPVNLTVFEVPVIWNKYLFVFLLLARSFGIFYTKFMKGYSDYQKIWGCLNKQTNVRFQETQTYWVNWSNQQLLILLTL